MFQKLRCWLLVSSVCLSACVTPMQMSPEKLKSADIVEGTVVGSLQIKGGADILGRRKWSLEAIPVPDNYRAPVFRSISPYTIQATRDGEEELFVTKMPPGLYSFWKLYQPGFSGFTQRTDVYFTVRPGTVTYVGRLVVEFPPGLISTGDGIPTLDGTPPCSALKIKLRVEDAAAPTLKTARENHGLSADVVVPDLMAIRDVCHLEFD